MVWRRDKRIFTSFSYNVNSITQVLTLMFLSWASLCSEYMIVFCCFRGKPWESNWFNSQSKVRPAEIIGTHCILQQRPWQNSRGSSYRIKKGTLHCCTKNKTSMFNKAKKNVPTPRKFSMPASNRFLWIFVPPLDVLLFTLGSDH